MSTSNLLSASSFKRPDHHDKSEDTSETNTSSSKSTTSGTFETMTKRRSLFGLGGTARPRLVNRHRKPEVIGHDQLSPDSVRDRPSVRKPAAKRPVKWYSRRYFRWLPYILVTISCIAVLLLRIELRAARDELRSVMEEFHEIQELEIFKHSAPRRIGAGEDLKG